MSEGADILDVGAVKAGPGPEVSEDEELNRLMPAVEGLVARFDLPVSVDTWRASVAAQAFRAGAVLGNDISGFADPKYLEVAAAAGASVVATHIRLAPRVPDPEPAITTWWRGMPVPGGTSRVGGGRRHPARRVLVDAGLDLGKTASQSLELLRASSTLAGLGYPLLLSASNKTFLGDLSTWRSTSAGRRPSPPTPSGSPSGAGWCGRTTFVAPAGYETCWQRSWRRDERTERRQRRHPGRRRAGSAGDGAGAAPAERGGAGATNAWLFTGDDAWLLSGGGRTGGRAGRRARAVLGAGGVPGEELDVAAVVGACRTPPFLADRRVVVLRDAGRFDRTSSNRCSPTWRSRCPPQSSSWPGEVALSRPSS